jgi:hypothetical protein
MGANDFQSVDFIKAGATDDGERGCLHGWFALEWGISTVLFHDKNPPWKERQKRFSMFSKWTNTIAASF